MVTKKKAFVFLFLFVSGFSLGVALAADRSSKLTRITTPPYKYDGKEANKGINPDEAVDACGAALQDGIPTGGKETEYGEDLNLWPDVDSWILGIEIVGSVMTKSKIPFDTTKMPIKRSQIFTTYQDNQTTVSIKVYECPRFKTDCRQLRSFDLTGIPPSPKGVPQIEVTFEVTSDVDGYHTLHVRAEDIASKKSESITIPNCDHKLSKEEIETYLIMMEEAVEEYKKNKESIDKLETYIHNTRSTINDKDKLVVDKINSDDKEKVERILKETLEWLGDTQKRKMKDYDEKFKVVEAVCNPIIKRVYEL